MPSKTKRRMWIDEVLKTTMDVVERGTHSLRGRCTIKWLTFVIKWCFFMGTFYSNAYGD
jgi:hypothetical protein